MFLVFKELSFFSTVVRSVFNLNLRKAFVMENKEIIERLHANNMRGEELVKFIERELPVIRAAAIGKYYEKKEQQLQELQAQLKRDLQYWQNKVIELEIMNNIPQYSVPSHSCTSIVKIMDSEVPQPVALSSADNKDISPKPEAGSGDKKAAKKDSKKEKKVKESKSEEDKTMEDKPINVSRLDMRVGRILNATKHPDAESLYVEQIDIGESKPRTVVSGLVKYVPLEEMQNRLVILLCNLKPAKMRGVTSEAMVMCASTPEKVEILVPPSESVPGDRVVCDDFPGEPDSLLPPKKKIFEQVAPDLKTNDNCVATYKACPLKVLNKGEIKASSLKNVQIK